MYPFIIYNKLGDLSVILSFFSTNSSTSLLLGVSLPYIQGGTMNSDTISNHLCLALDNDSLTDSRELIYQTCESIGVYKIGMQAFYSVGPPVLEIIRQQNAQIFLDLKLCDIPNTVAKAACALTRMGVDFLSIHTMGGKEMMQYAKDAILDESEKLSITPPLLIGVTVLTSLDDYHLNEELGITRGVEDQVLHLAELAVNAGLDGIVASPREARRIRAEQGESLYLVTPGVRLPGDAVHDQKRTTPPKKALDDGSNLLVIGRPITTAINPKEAAALFYDALKSN